MAEFLLVHASFVRLAGFAGVLIVMSIWEALAPRRPQAFGRLQRWPSNLGIVLLDSLAVRLCIPVGLAAFAAYATEQHWGLFNLVAVPGWLAVLSFILLMDLTIYAQHVVFHKIPVLWRLHRMHHSDLEIDVTTGARFHPIEILLSVLVKMVAIVILGAPAIAVLGFEVLLNATAMFNHSNAMLPLPVDAAVRRLLVTPDMHRVHHSVIRAETDSNFGFNLSVWDQLFGTYREQPQAGHDGMTIGIEKFRKGGELRLDKMLTQPFREQ